MAEQDELNNVSQVTVLSTRVYYPEKAQFISKSDEHGNKMAAQLAELVRAFNKDKLASPEEYEELSSKLSDKEKELKAKDETLSKLRQAESDYKEQLEKAQKQVSDKQKQKDELQKQLDNKDKQLDHYEKHSKKINDKSDEKIKKLEKELQECKDKLKYKEAQRKSEASKRQSLEQRLIQANNYLDEITGGMLGPEKKQF